MEAKYELHPGEKVLKILIPHKIWYLRFIIVFLLGVSASFIVGMFYPEGKVGILFSIFWMQIYAIFLYKSVMDYEFSKAIITNFRVICFQKVRFFEYNFYEFFYENISEIKVIKKGILQNTFDYGKILFLDKQNHILYTFDNFPKPILSAQSIYDTMNKYFQEFHKKS